jgi:hypothetical protein
MEGAMTELGRRAKFLVETASGGDEPTAENRARVRAAIAAQLAAASGAATMAAAKSSAAAAGAAGSAIPGSVATVALVSLALVSALGVGTAMYVRSSTPANKTVPSMPTRAAAPATRAPPDSSAHAAIFAPAEPAPLPAERAVGEKHLPVSKPPSAAVRARARVSGTSVEAEMLLIGEAREALQSRDAAHALLLLDEHADRFPSGALGEERDALRVTSLCALGRVAEARAAASQFLRASPDSPHAGRVRASCGSDSDSTF